MKINYFFTIFNQDEIKDFYENFVKSEFYKKHTENEMFFCCEKENKKTIKYLLRQKEQNKNIILLIFDKKFCFNDAFCSALNYFDGDVVLLGDSKIKKQDLIFQKCLEKYEKKASIVHVVKKHTGFKGFIKNILEKSYNFFIKIFTNKKDRLNVVSLGLIDKDVIDLLKELPQKASYLKNTKDLKGFESRTIYIDEKTQVHQLNFKQKTPSLISAIAFGSLFLANLLAIIFLNIFLKLEAVFNIIFGVSLIIYFIVICLYLPKHFFDIRNMPSNNEYKIEKK